MQWLIGNGTSIPAINQPWFEMWQTQQALTNAQRDMMVSNMFDHQQNRWRESEIEIVLGAQAVPIRWSRIVSFGSLVLEENTQLNKDMCN